MEPSIHGIEALLQQHRHAGTRAALGAGDQRSARQAAESAVRSDPEFAEAWTGLAWVVAANSLDSRSWAIVGTASLGTALYAAVHPRIH